jgi:hypothetical protein
LVKGKKLWLAFRLAPRLASRLGLEFLPKAVQILRLLQVLWPGCKLDELLECRRGFSNGSAHAILA